MKNALIGLTDNPSSNGDSSLLTIGLPSVMNAQSCIQLKGNSDNHSNINLNMNVNFNIHPENKQEKKETESAQTQIQPYKKSDCKIQLKQQELAMNYTT